MNFKISGLIYDFKNRINAEIVEVPKILDYPHFPGLDGFRGLSIILVVASHFAAYTRLTNYFYGDIGVEIFFVISGFLITSLLLKEKVKRGQVSFKKFYLRRLLRIVPVSYLFLIILLLINNLYSLGISTGNFLSSFLYFRNLPYDNYYEWYTGHYWSLSVEEQFYLLFPFIIVKRTKFFVYLSMFLILFMPILGFLGFNNIGVFYSNKIIHVLTFLVLTLFGKGTMSILVGSIYSILIFKKIIIIENLKNGYFFSFGLLVFAFAILMKISIIHIDYFSNFLFPFIIGYVIVSNLKGHNFLRNILENRVLKQIGILSYSIYIWQELFTTKLSFGFSGYFDSIPVRIVIIGVVSYLSYRYFEKAFLKYKHKFKTVED